MEVYVNQDVTINRFTMLQIYVLEKGFLANGQIICCKSLGQIILNKSANNFDAHLQEILFQEHWQLNLNCVSGLGMLALQ